MSNIEHNKNLYLCQILPTLIKDISFSDRKKIFKSCDKQEGKDVRTLNYKRKLQQYPIRTSDHIRPTSALSSLKPWVDYSSHNPSDTLRRNILQPSPILEAVQDCSTKLDKDQSHVKNISEDYLQTEHINHNHAPISQKMKPLKQKIPSRKNRLAKETLNSPSRPPLHFPKHIVQKRFTSDNELPFAFTGPVPVSTIKEFKKPTLSEKKVLESVIAMPIDLLEKLSLKLKRNEILTNDYSKKVHKVSKVKTEAELGKWILSQNKKFNK